MNRRGFFKLLGTGAATAIGAPAALEEALKAKPARIVRRGLPTPKWRTLHGGAYPSGHLASPSLVDILTETNEILADLRFKEVAEYVEPRFG